MTQSDNSSIELYLGVDGGGTKTQALLGCLRYGSVEILGAGQGGPSNPRAVGFDQAFHNIDQAISAAFESANLNRVRAMRIVLCLAGAGRTEEKSAVEAWSVQSDIATEARAVSEAEAVLEASHQAVDPIQSERSEAEIALICGTGSLAWGRKTEDHSCFARSGGWGYLLGDEGSGFWIGKNLLQVACQAADCRSTDKEVLDAVLRHLQLNSPSQLIGWCYEDSASRQRIASIAPLAFQLADQNIDDGIKSLTVANLIRQASNDLAAMVNAVSKQLNTSRYRLCVAGSVILHQPSFLQQVVDQLIQLGSNPWPVCVVNNPSLGCLRLATA